MNSSGSGERREFYRLRYPDTDRPLARTTRGPFPVAELSEGGIRLIVCDGEPGVGAPVVGYLVFHDGVAARVEGSVLRHDAGEAVVRLTLGVPLRRMVAEQQRLIHVHPTHFDRIDSAEGGGRSGTA